MVKICGIDTGLHGAIVCIDGKNVTILDTPIMANGKGKNDYDIAAMRVALIELAPDRILLERAQAMPGQGTVSMFTTGMGYGIWKGLIGGLQIPLQLIHPRVWQKLMFVGCNGDTKDISYQVGSSLYPQIAGQLKGPRGGLKDGRCDALMIAEYGRRTYTAS